MSGLTCVGLDLWHLARVGDPDTRGRVSRLLADMQARTPDTRFARLELRPTFTSRTRAAASKLARRALPAAANLLPPRAMSLAEELSLAAMYRPSRSRLPTRVGARVVFCPAVGPSFHDPRVALVCGIDSLAFAVYPESFGVEEVFARSYLLRRAVGLAARVVCPSEFVRDQVVEVARVKPERVAVIRPSLPASGPGRSPELLTQLGLMADEFLLYPAPFVGYANHRLLLIAFAQYRAKQPDPRLKLVCVGSTGSERATLEDSLKRMRLVDSVTLSSAPADALYTACRGVILPQLYEASGRTAWQAMAAGVPVLSSGAGALGEVVGHAGVCFDPRQLDSVREAIALAERAPDSYRALGGKGQARFDQASRGPSEAEQYLRLMSEVA